MENQHKFIKGYRDLTAEEIALINDIKANSEKTGELVQKLRETLPILSDVCAIEVSGDAMEVMSDEACEALRWLQIGQDHLQQGFMALTRSVARPSTF